MTVAAPPRRDLRRRLRGSRWLPVLTILLITIAGAVITWFRVPAGDQDRVWAEDANIFLHEALEYGPWTVLFNGYAGYQHFVPRLVLAVIFPFFDLADYAVLVFAICSVLTGLTAAAVAAAAPDRVRDLVIVDITPGVDPDAGPSQVRAFFAGPTDWADRDELVERALSFGLGGSRRAAERGVFLNSRVRPDGRVEWKHHFAHLAAAAANAGTAAPAGAVGGVLSATGWEDLAAVTAPITLIRGDRGYVTEADAAAFADRLPAAQVVEVPAHHNVHEELPARLAALIRATAAG